MTEATLNGLQKLPRYRQLRTNIFKSEGSLQWFVRQHRQGLIDSGALVLLAGQWCANESRFDAYVLQAGMDAAKLHSEAT